MNHHDFQVYLNEQFVPRSQAVLDIEDRGTLFGDGVYEVIRYYNGKPLAMQEHLSRLRISLAEINIAEPDQVKKLDAISEELVRRNRLKDAKVYWQITRGSALRNPVFPDRLAPTIFVITYPEEPIDMSSPPPGLKTILIEDVRWHYCSIKSLQLLPNILAKNRAIAAGVDEAILHRQGWVTESTTTSVFMSRRGSLWTHPADQWILGGITRGIILDLAKIAEIPVFEQVFTIDDLLSADEVFVCGTTTLVSGVIQVDQHLIGEGQVGPVTTRLRSDLIKYICEKCV